MAQLCSSTPGCAAFSVISPTYSGHMMCEMHPETIAQSSQANQFWSVWQSDAPKPGKWPYAPGAKPPPPPPPPPHEELAWDTPSKDVTGSMPLGNGKLGLNVHADSTDTVWLLLSHIDALDENTNLDKLGRVAVRATTADDDAATQPFRQEMHLTNATVHIDLTSGVSLDVWVDATTDAVRVESSSPTPHKLEATLEVWRNSTGPYPGGFSVCADLHPNVTLHPDVVEAHDDGILFYHRNLEEWTNPACESIQQRSAPPHDTSGRCCQQG